MAVVITNVSTNTLQISDLGDPFKYGIDYALGQKVWTLAPSETLSLVETDEVRNSVRFGDIKKYVDDSMITVDFGSGYVQKQIVIDGVASGALGLTDVASVESMLAVVSATGAPATKFLLDLTTDYTVASGDISLVTDQSLNKLIITYYAL